MTRPLWLLLAEAGVIFAVTLVVAVLADRLDGWPRRVGYALYAVGLVLLAWTLILTGGAR